MLTTSTSTAAGLVITPVAGINEDTGNWWAAAS